VVGRDRRYRENARDLASVAELLRRILHRLARVYFPSLPERLGDLELALVRESMTPVKELVERLLAPHHDLQVAEGCDHECRCSHCEDLRSVLSLIASTMEKYSANRSTRDG